MASDTELHASHRDKVLLVPRLVDSQIAADWVRPAGASFDLSKGIVDNDVLYSLPLDISARLTAHSCRWIFAIDGIVVPNCRPNFLLVWCGASICAFHSDSFTLNGMLIGIRACADQAVRMCLRNLFRMVFAGFQKTLTSYQTAPVSTGLTPTISDY